MKTARTLIVEATAACRASPFIETPGDRRAEVEDLLHFVAQRPVAAGEPVEGPVLAKFRRLIARRVAGEPIEYLTGQATFREMTLRVGPGAFIPRPSSGFLADVAIELVKDRPTPLLVDIGTGVGPVALSVAAKVPAADVYGVDISARAVAFSRKNARSLGLPNVRFVRGDLFEPLPRKLLGRVDAVAAHPPYAARWEMRHVRYEFRYEPTEAITDSSKSGLTLVGRIVREAPRWLAPRGWLLVQIVDYRAREVAAMYRKAGFGRVRHMRTKGEYDRVIAGRMPDPRDVARQNTNVKKERDYSDRSRIQKLGVGPGSVVSVLGLRDPAFLEELEHAGAEVSLRRRKGADLVFLLAEDPAGLKKLAELEPLIKRNGSIWVVSPRGRPEIRDVVVIEAAKRAGLVDNKVVRFSDTHTALKLVIPVARRSDG
jgi:release factor glutamine methyltransferase